MSARHMIEAGAQARPVLTLRACVTCCAPISPAPRKRFCVSCYKAHAKAKAKAYYHANAERRAKVKAAVQKWREGHREAARASNRRWAKRYPEKLRAKTRRWAKANPDKIKAMGKRRVARLKAERAPRVAARRAELAARKAAKAAAKARAKIERQRGALIAWQAGSNTDLAAIAALVPRGVPGRDDVCQSLALAMLEGTITRDTLADHVGKHVAAFNRNNFEGRGFAISLSEPRHDGRSWDDVLPDDGGRAWA